MSETIQRFVALNVDKTYVVRVLTPKSSALART